MFFRIYTAFPEFWKSGSDTMPSPTDCANLMNCEFYPDSANFGLSWWVNITINYKYKMTCVSIRFIEDHRTTPRNTCKKWVHLFISCSLSSTAFLLLLVNNSVNFRTRNNAWRMPWIKVRCHLITHWCRPVVHSVDLNRMDLVYMVGHPHLWKECLK